MKDLTALTAAISGAEGAIATLGSKDANQASAQKRFDDAAAAKAVADEEDAGAVLAFNTAMDAISEAAQAAKLEVLPK